MLTKNEMLCEMAKTIRAKAAIALAGDEMTKEKTLKLIVELAQNIIDCVEGY